MRLSKPPHLGIVCSSLCFVGACSTPPEQIGQSDSGISYLGEASPGDTAVLFAPGLVSVEGRYEYGVSFSPEGRELLITAHEPDEPAVLLHYFAADSGWTGPEEIRLSEGQKAEEMEAFFTPDGRWIYFAAYDEGLDVRIWGVARDQEGPRSPWQLDSPLADGPAFYPTTTSDGTVYYSNLSERRIFRAKVDGESIGPAEDTGIEAMHAFIAPDESYVIVDARRGEEGTKADLFVAFRQPDGTWSKLVDLGPGVNTEFSETCPSLSPDGKYLFFSRYNEEHEVSNIYWVRSTVVQSARESLPLGL